MVVLFPNEVSLSDRYVDINLYEQDKPSDNNAKKTTVKLDKPLSGVIFKTRKMGYEIPKRDIPFILLSFYMHGPIDPNSNF